jgi:hypothetical protein
MKRKFLIDPHQGVGPLRFGMTRVEVAAIMKEKPYVRDLRDEGGELTEMFQDVKVQVIYDRHERAAAVQLVRKLAGVVYPPAIRMDGAYDDVLAWAKKADPNLTIERERFRSDALGIVAEAKNQDSGDEIRHLELVLVFRPRYYEDAKEHRAASRKKTRPRKRAKRG